MTITKKQEKKARKKEQKRITPKKRAEFLS
jgi:hypothetical protein